MPLLFALLSFFRRKVEVILCTRTGDKPLCYIFHATNLSIVIRPALEC